ncbi:MAG: hypothetical protein AAGF12_11585 [Myxococcota bacterium]
MVRSAVVRTLLSVPVLVACDDARTDPVPLESDFAANGEQLLAGSLDGDAWAARFAGTDRPVWQSILDTGGTEAAYGVTELTDGLILLGGEVDGDAWVVLLSSEGQVQWEQRFGEAGARSRATAVGEGVSRDLIVVGSRTGATGADSGAFVFRLDRSGVLLSQRVFSGVEFVPRRVLPREIDDGIYLIGRSGPSAWAAAVSAAGQLEWSVNVNGLAGAAITDGVAQPGELWLTGTTVGIGSPTDLFFARLNRGGEALLASVVQTVGEERSPQFGAFESEANDGLANIVLTTDSFGTQAPGDQDLWWLTVSTTGELDTKALHGSRDQEAVVRVRGNEDDGLQVVGAVRRIADTNEGVADASIQDASDGGDAAVIPSPPTQTGTVVTWNIVGGAVEGCGRPLTEGTAIPFSLAIVTNALDTAEADGAFSIAPTESTLRRRSGTSTFLCNP